MDGPPGQFRTNRSRQISVGDAASSSLHRLKKPAPRVGVQRRQLHERQYPGRAVHSGASPRSALVDHELGLRSLVSCHSPLIKTRRRPAHTIRPLQDQQRVNQRSQSIAQYVRLTQETRSYCVSQSLPFESWNAVSAIFLLIVSLSCLICMV